MTAAGQRTLFAFDCGATNWRLYRAQYDVIGNKARLQGEPSPSPLTSFVDRRLPAVLQLTPDGNEIECYGEMAQSQIEDEANRLRIRDYFKPCIGAHLDPNPQPHQLKFTHKEALEFTRLMLEAVLAQLLREKWRTGSFDERVMFTFAFPVHWQTEYEGAIFKDFSTIVRACLPEDMHENVRFVSEPEGAILSLQRQGHLRHLPSGQATLIVDVGGSTTDLVAGEVEPTTGELLFIGRYGEAFGGGHYDMAIARSITDELLIPASAIADDPGALLALRNVAKRLKESLSRQLLLETDALRVPQRTVTLVTRDGEIYRGVVRLDQTRFRDLTKDLSSRFEGLMARGMEAIGLNDDEVGQVVLVGGGAQLHSIFQYLNERFIGKDFVLADNPDESVVSGVSLEYGAATSKSRPSLLFMPDFEHPAPEQPAPEAPAFLLIANDEAINLSNGTNRVGRAPTNEVHIISEKISRFHVKLVVSGNSIEVADLGSTNGTFVNDVRLEKDQVVTLELDDEIRFGDRRLKLQSAV